MFYQKGCKPQSKSSFIFFMKEENKPDKKLLLPIKNQQIPNLKYQSNTWDAKHLDKFLKNLSILKTEKESLLLKNNNENIISITERDTNEIIKPLEKVYSTSTLYKSCQKSLHTNSKNSLSKESHYFRAQPRFKEKKSNYELNNFIKSFSSTNYLAQEGSILLKSPKKVNKNSFNTFEEEYNHRLKTKTFDYSKLLPIVKDNNICASKIKLNELKEIKNNRDNFKNWKENLADMNKYNRIIKNSYRSGVLNLDHPLNNQTIYYKDEWEKLNKKMIRENSENEKYRKFILQHTQTNDNISFFNKNSKERNEKFDNFPDIYDQRKKKNISDYWIGKKKIENKEKNMKTDQRIFGNFVEKFYYGRAKHLLEEDNRGKNFNIIGNINSEVVLNDSIFEKERKNIVHY